MKNRFSKKKTTSTFSKFSAKRLSIMIQALTNILKNLIKQKIAKTLSTLNFTSKKSFDFRSRSNNSSQNLNDFSQQSIDSQQSFDLQ
jgi:capsule polysaccharide export protein KpsE/RkpR